MWAAGGGGGVRKTVECGGGEPLTGLKIEGGEVGRVRAEDGVGWVERKDGDKAGSKVGRTGAGGMHKVIEKEMGGVGRNELCRTGDVRVGGVFRDGIGGVSQSDGGGGVVLGFEFLVVVQVLRLHHHY
ncbi:hypothetical protein Tco_0397996 [Tanacetum coccineum]